MVLLRTPLVFAVCLPMACLAAQPTTLAHLPGSNVYAVQTDAAGNIYLAGFQGSFAKANPFVAKLSPTGQTLYSTTFAGSNFGIAWAIAVDAAGSAYVFGNTNSADFPVTPGALQTTMQARGFQGFAAKLDANGKVVYSTFIGGTSGITPGLTSAPRLNSIVVDSAGDAILTGQAAPSLPNSTPFPPSAFPAVSNNGFFVIKLDPLGAKILAGIGGVGGEITMDGQGNIYVAGMQYGTSSSALPATPGAFQSEPVNVCGQLGAFFTCGYPYVAKLNGGLTQILYSTYVSGKYGGLPAAISVNAQGNVFVAGATNSPDYPTTASAYEPQYVASAVPRVSCFFIIHCVNLPPASGYLTEVNATGSGLIYSSYFSGTQTDTITFAAFTPNAIYLSGSAGSADLPGFTGFPQPCLPQTYATRLSADATGIGASRIEPGNVLAYDAFAGTLIVWTGADLVAVDPNAPKTPIACILDSADLQPVTSVAPGELVSLFGDFSSGSASTPPSGQFQTSLGGVTVAVNGVASPLLYAGPEQINFQIPFAIAGAAQASIALTSALPNLSDSSSLPIVAANPVPFLLNGTTPSPALATCINESSASVNGLLPLAFNPDGSLNTCLNPAAAGSVVTMVLEGLGVQNSPDITANGGVTVASVSALPGAISGVWQIGIAIPANQPLGGFQFSLSAGGAPVRDADLVVWIK